MPILASRAATAPYHGWFIQDDWKITPRLTVNMGLRYEIDFGTTERFNRIIQTFDPFVANPVEAAVRANYALNPIPEIRPEDFRVPGGLIFAGPNNRNAFRPDMNNFQPRFGAAYQIGSRTAIRGGWAMFMVPFILDGLNQNGFNRNTPVVPSPDLGLTFTSSLANPWPGGLVPQANLGLTSLLGQGVGTISPLSRRNGLVQRWEFSIQHELPGRWLLEGAYHGNRGFDLITNVDANPVARQYQSTSPMRDQPLINFLDTPVSNPFRNVDGFQGTNLYTASVINRRQLLRPFPHFTGITSERFDGSSSFHSGQLRAEKRFAQGYTVLASYVYSKFLERLTLLNPTDARYENRLNELDVPHRVVLSGIWELPWGRGRAWGSNWSGWKQSLLGGFQIQTIYQYQAGTPLTLGNSYFNGNLSGISPRVASETIGALGTTNVDDNVFEQDLRFTGFYINDAATQVNGQPVYNLQRNDTRINLADNLRTLPSRVNNYRNQPLNLIDLSLIKNFAFTERVYLQLRGEVINAFNHYQFQGPVLNSRDTNFGRVTNADIIQLPREFQLALRLVF